MTDRLRTVKSKAMFLMILFAVFITLLVFALSSKVIYDFQRRVTIQSTEFNLQLVGRIIAQDMRELEMFSRWCGADEIIAGALSANDGDLMDGWRSLSGEFYNSRVASFINRLLIFEYASKRVLQVGNLINASVPVTWWNVESVFGGGISADPGWQGITADPFYPNRTVPVLPLVQHLYHPDMGNAIGIVILAASTSLFTGRLAAYKAPSDTELYLTIQNKWYRIEGEDLIPVEPSWTELSRTGAETIGPETLTIDIREQDGQKRTLVTYPVREGVNLTQTLHRLKFFPAEGAWPALAAGIGALLLLLGLLWFGISRQTGDIALLMEERIAEEKKAQDMEYRMLLNQIHPHFLYNTLNSIKWMASIQNATGIVEMITALSRLLRTVAKDTRKTAPLREELILLEDYMVIQKYRYGDSVVLKKAIDNESLLDTTIPRFTLQPLAENAIFHGLEPKGGGVITVRVQEDPDDTSRILVSVEDDGVGMNAETISAIHTNGKEKAGLFQKLGLRNVEERLRYAGAEGPEISSEEGKFTIITISFRRDSDHD